MKMCSTQIRTPETGSDHLMLFSGRHMTHLGGSLSIIVIVVENEIGDPSSNRRRG